MDRYFIVSEDTEKEIKSLNSQWTNEFNRVIIQINRRTDGYSIIISGPDDEVIRFIDRLEDNGIVLNT